MSHDTPLVSSRRARWSLIFAGSAVALLLVGVSSVRETYQGWKVDQEIHGLREQVAILEGRRSHLTETLRRLQSPEALDTEARLRLGLQKSGEQVFILKEVGGVRQEALGVRQEMIEPALSNPQKWWRYFFHPTF